MVDAVVHRRDLKATTRAPVPVFMLEAAASETGSADLPERRPPDGQTLVR